MAIRLTFILSDNEVVSRSKLVINLQKKARQS